ncbi:unnamed protein product [Brassica oleracea var. botrytis]
MHHLSLRFQRHPTLSREFESCQELWNLVIVFEYTK